jgi:hypothetical protein
VLGVALVATACGGQTTGSSGASVPVVTPGSSAVATTGAPSSAPTLTPSAAPTTPAATLLPSEMFQHGDVLKVQVNNLAARKAPDRSSGLVHRYDTSGESPVDKGEVRLDKGNLVSVAIGPLRAGNIVWYLVWPAPDGKPNGGTSDWYNGNPADVSGGPAWVAASLDASIYLVLQKRPSAGELSAVEPAGPSAAGVGTYESPPQPRHDAFLLDWAAAAPEQGSPCTFRMSLVPADAAVPPKKPVDTSTSGAKTSPLLGVTVSAPWLPIPGGSWTTFTVKITGSCVWAFHLWRLEHD